jgi:tripartite-type tricarboxylate transporter receptor subunit TctC
VSSYDDEGIDFAGKRMGALRWALYTPTGTPKPIVDKLSAALKQVIDMPDVQARLLELGITASFVGGEQLREMTATDIDAWKQLAAAAKISNE